MFLFLFTVALLLLAQSSEATDSGPFVPAQPTKRASPIYPINQVTSGHEGWAQFEFMVSKRGRPTQIELINAVGATSFVSAAKDALKKYRFRPSRLNGEPIESTHKYKLSFEIETDFSRTSQEDFSQIRELARQIEEGKEDQVRRDISSALKGGFTMREGALLAVLQFNFYRKLGSLEDQLMALDLALDFGDAGEYLSEGNYRQLELARIDLLLELKRYARAESTVKNMLADSAFPTQHHEELSNVLSQIEQLKQSDTSFTLEASISDVAFWRIHLWRNHFELKPLSGNIKAARMWCARGYESLRVVTDFKYRASQDLGHCTLRVMGTPGSEFLFTQR